MVVAVVVKKKKMIKMKKTNKVGGRRKWKMKGRIKITTTKYRNRGARRNKREFKN